MAYDLNFMCSLSVDHAMIWLTFDCSLIAVYKKFKRNVYYVDYYRCIRNNYIVIYYSQLISQALSHVIHLITLENRQGIDW